MERKSQPRQADLQAKSLIFIFLIFVQLATSIPLAVTNINLKKDLDDQRSAACAAISAKASVDISYFKSMSKVAKNNPALAALYLNRAGNIKELEVAALQQDHCLNFLRNF